MRWYEVIWVWLSVVTVLVTGVLALLAGLGVVPDRLVLLSIGVTLCWLVLGAMPMVVAARRRRSLGPEREAVLREAEDLSSDLVTDIPYRMTLGSDDEGELILSTTEEKHLVYRALLRVIRTLGVTVDH